MQKEENKRKALPEHK